MTGNIAGRFIDLHIIQAVPFANLNRDDTNSVKTVQFGGASRTRISSQSWKRAIRMDIEQSTGQGTLRTRRVAEALSEHLQQAGWPDGLATKAGIYTVMASSIGAKAPKPKKNDAADADTAASSEPEVPWGTKAMVFIPQSAIADLAHLAAEHRTALEAAADLKSDDKKAADAAKKVLPAAAIDKILLAKNGVINLMGRMLAELDGAGVDGAVQVAHVISTHATDIEIDYFSAVDDITASWGDQTGSAHMGHNEYSAGTFYRYCTIDLADLLRNVGGADDARALAQAFLASAIGALPQAKKNSTAPHTFPDLIAVSVRADRPLSYVSAFEAPVSAAASGYNSASISTLDDYVGALNKLIGPAKAPLKNGWAGTTTWQAANLGDRYDSVEELLTAALEDAFKVRSQA